MKILKFNQINESESYKEAKEIINTLYIVCDELTDEGIEWRISPDRDDDLRIKIIGLKINSMWESDTHFYIDVDVSNLNEKQRIKVKEIFQTIENYSRSIGLDFYYNYYGVRSGQYMSRYLFSTDAFDWSLLSWPSNALRIGLSFIKKVRFEFKF